MALRILGRIGGICPCLHCHRQPLHYKYHKTASRYLGGMGNKDDGNNNDDNYDDIKGRASVTMTQVLGM